MEPGIRAVVERILPEVDALTVAMVDRYAREIKEYATLDAATRSEDVRRISEIHTRDFLANAGGPPGDPSAVVNETADGAARRVHQGVPLEPMLHAVRVWGRMMWAAVLGATDPEIPEEREAALGLASRLMEQMDLIATTFATGYMDEAESFWSDREVVRRDLLEALLGGRGDTGSVRQQAAALRVTLEDAYVVVIAHLATGAAAEPDRRTLPARSGLREALAAVKRHLAPASGSLLVGMRHGEIVALYPARGPAELERIRGQCAAIADAARRPELQLGVGGWHPGLAGIAGSHGEAREALKLAGDGPEDPAIVAFDDILVQHAVRASASVDRTLADALVPLRTYDERRKGSLLETLRAYCETTYNVTRAAERLHVHPNTVVYRLRRIRELTGRDPHDADDLLLLTLALKRDR